MNQSFEPVIERNVEISKVAEKEADVLPLNYRQGLGKV